MKGSISGEARDFNSIQSRNPTKFFLYGKATTGIHTILIETLGEYAPPYATVEHWVAQFKRGDFSTCVVPRPRRPKSHLPGDC